MSKRSSVGTLGRGRATFRADDRSPPLTAARSRLFCIFSLLCWACLLPSIASAGPREWSTSDGKFKVEAQLIGFDGDLVRLKKSDGKEVTVAATRLSPADRAYLATQKAPLAADLPAGVAKFQESLKATREAEAKRLRKRIEAIQGQLAKAKVPAKRPAPGKGPVASANPGVEKMDKDVPKGYCGCGKRLRKGICSQGENAAAGSGGAAEDA
jgi:hypothetical protein